MKNRVQIWLDNQDFFDLLFLFRGSERVIIEEKDKIFYSLLESLNEAYNNNSNYDLNEEEEVK